MYHPAHRLSLLAALVASAAASAQPAPAASQPSAAERAQRDADKVFQMILQHADKPRRVVREERPAAPAAAPAPAVPARAAARSATAPGVPTQAPAAAPAVLTAPVAPPTAPDAVPSAAVAAVPAAVDAPSTPAPVEVAAPRSAKLELVSSVEPDFPSRLVRSLGHGSVLVNFDVRADGSVSRTEVVRSSHRGLNAAAEAAVAAWRFKPIGEARPGVVELKFE